ncbi:hypothetical protein Cni_G00030 [Canna indica]|uniref:Uncharacterized protein n=1 Tax=Canna indica TaxID=4628 RepID=A0AAQ3JKB3_9LILI|nr:hypothetical protein Cni_G00030 [Canna indica]
MLVEVQKNNTNSFESKPSQYTTSVGFFLQDPLFSQDRIQNFSHFLTSFNSISIAGFLMDPYQQGLGNGLNANPRPAKQEKSRIEKKRYKEDHQGKRDQEKKGSHTLKFDSTVGDDQGRYILSLDRRNKRNSESKRKDIKKIIKESKIRKRKEATP